MKILIILLFINISVAQELSETVCSEFGEKYGNLNLIPESCFQEFLNNALPNNGDVKNDDQLLAVGKRNILYLKNETELKLEIDDKKIQYKSGLYTISGHNSRLRSIASVSLSPKFDEVAVINEYSSTGKEVLVFPTYRSGNIKPYKVIDEKYITGAKVVLFHPEKKELIILNSERKSIIFLSSEVSSISTNKKRRPKVLREISGVKTLLTNPIGMAIYKDIIYVLQDDINELYGYSLSEDGDSDPLIAYDRKELNVNNPKYIEISPKGECILTNEDGESDSFLLQ